MCAIQNDDPKPCFLIQVYFPNNLATPAYVIKITAGNYPPISGNYSNELKDLVSAMLSLQPHNRPSVHSILQLDFIKKKVNEVLEGTLRKYE